MDSPRVNHGMGLLEALADSNLITLTGHRADMILTAKIDSSMGKETFSITNKGRHTRIAAVSKLVGHSL